MKLDWFVVSTWDGCELDARRELRALGFECEYPLTRLPRNSRGERRVVPLFPGYVFVRANDAWPAIRSARSAAFLLMSAGRPSRVSDVDIQFFMTWSVDSLGYFVDPCVRVFRVGDVVRSRCGRFAGVGGEFSRMLDDARCEVIYSLLGQRVTSTHAVCDLT